MSRAATTPSFEHKATVEQLLADLLDIDKREKALSDLTAQKDNIPNIVSLTHTHAAAHHAPCFVADDARSLCF